MANIHLMGIGGIGVSAVAKLLIEKGEKVSGCDPKLSPVAKKLEKMGATIYKGHDPEHINREKPDILVYSSAVKSDDPEFLYAKEHSVNVTHRAKMLSGIIKDKDVIAVTGTHGKTTTSFMIAYCLYKADKNPGFAIGGEMKKLDGNAKWTESKYFVVEADESDGTHVNFDPYCAVITNIDLDHMDHYMVFSQIGKSMREFIGKIRKGGFLVVCGEDKTAMMLFQKASCDKVSYGFDDKYDIYAEGIELLPYKSRFRVVYKGSMLGEIALGVPGRHNVLNSLACIAICIKLDIPFDIIASALSEYCGVGRRLEVLYESDSTMIIDDYAHHPNEIKNVVQAVKAMGRKRCVGIFQPHRFSRTKLLKSHFGDCFDGFDKLVIMDIYGAGEKPIEGVNGSMLYEEVVKYGKTDPVYIESKNDVIRYIMAEYKPGDVLVFIGAGDVTELAHSVTIAFLTEKKR